MGHFVFSFLTIVVLWAACFPRHFGESLALEHKKFMEGWERVYPKHSQKTNDLR